MNCSKQVPCSLAEGCCECPPGFSYIGDTARKADCLVQTEIRTALYSFGLVLWIIGGFMCMLAIRLLKRKSKATFIPERRLLYFALFTTISTSITHILAVSGNGEYIGIDIPITIAYFFAHIGGWGSLLSRTFGRSETSIARFNVERSKSIKTWYFRLLAIPGTVLILAPVVLFVNLGYPEFEPLGVQIFFLIYAFSAGSFGLLNLWTGLVTQKDFERAIIRSSVEKKQRIAAFRDQTRKILFIQTLTNFFVSIFGLVFGFCFECRPYAYISFAVIDVFAVLKYFQVFLVSIRTSLKNARFSVKEPTPKSDSDPDKEIPEDTSASGSIKIVRRNKKQRKSKKKKRPTSKKMTAVLEASNEGTVVMTELDVQEEEENKDDRTQTFNLKTVEEENLSSMDGRPFLT